MAEFFNPFEDGPVRFNRKNKPKSTPSKYKKYMGASIDDVHRKLNPKHRSIWDIKQAKAC